MLYIFSHCKFHQKVQYTLSLDVTSLYTTIPNQEGINATASYLFKYRNSNHNPTNNSLCKLLELVLTANACIISHNNEFRHVYRGVELKIEYFYPFTFLCADIMAFSINLCTKCIFLVMFRPPPPPPLCGFVCIRVDPPPPLDAYIIK